MTDTAPQSLLWKVRWLGLIVLVLAGLAAWFFFDTPDAPHFSQAPVTLQRADGSSLTLVMDIADTQPQQKYGLMFRKSLPDDYGMLFIWEYDQQIHMWMKNTYVPLDMLFVRSDGVIVKIITNAEPLNLNILSSDQPIRAVIEMKAGMASRHKLNVGDRVLYSGLDGGK